MSETLRAALVSGWNSRRALAGARFERRRDGEVRRSVQGPHRQLRRELFEQVLADVENSGAQGLLDQAAVRQRVRRVLDAVFERYDAPPLSDAEREEMEQELVAEATGYGPLSALLADATVSDVLVNGHDTVFIDRFGRLERASVRFDDDAHLLHFISRLVAGHDRHIDSASPYVDVRLRDGSRLHAVVPPLTPSPVLCIRRSRAIPFSLEQLTLSGTLSAPMADYLTRAVESGANIVISGGVGSGKTTLLNVLAGFIPTDARIVTIEETAELRLPHPHVVSLESRLPNNEGRGEITLRTLVRNALRMRADRLIVGEVRGSEVFDMLQAMNTGHAGSLTTVHANSSNDAIRRLESLVMLAGFPLPSQTVRELLAMTVHVVVQLHRAANGSRRIVEIDEMNPETCQLKPCFRYDGQQHVAMTAASQ